MPAENHLMHRSPFGHVTHEYLLPVTSMAEEDRIELPIWLGEFVDSIPESIREVLKDRWADVELPCNKLLRDRLLEFVPYSIVRFMGESYLRICLPGAELDRSGNSLLLANPASESAIAERLNSIGLADNDEFAEFLQYFGGLRESLPPQAGDFVNEEDWQSASEIMYDDCEDFEEWQSGVCIYQACNGDCLVLHPSGKVAWFMHEENRFSDPYPTFGDFLSFYVRYNIDYACPLDAYAPPEHGRR
jgi:hypothetical protein